MPIEMFDSPKLSQHRVIRESTPVPHGTVPVGAIGILRTIAAEYNNHLVVKICDGYFQPIGTGGMYKNFRVGDTMQLLQPSDAITLIAK